jgi:hypothetical protein
MEDDNAFTFTVKQSNSLGLGGLAQEGLRSFVMLVNIYQSSCRNIPGVLNLQQHRYEKSKLV